MSSEDKVAEGTNGLYPSVKMADGEKSSESSAPPSPVSPTVDLRVPSHDAPQAPPTRPLAESSPPLSPVPHVNLQPGLSTSMHAELPSDADLPNSKVHLAPSEDKIPLNELFGSPKVDRAKKHFKARRDTNSTVPVAEKARIESALAPFIALTKIVDLAKESYQKLEKKSEKFASELKFMKSRVEDLEQKLQHSEAERTNAQKLADFLNS